MHHSRLYWLALPLTLVLTLIWLSPNSRERSIVAVTKDGRASLDPPPPAGSETREQPVTIAVEAAPPKEATRDPAPRVSATPSPAPLPDEGPEPDRKPAGTIEVFVVDPTRGAAVPGAFVEAVTHVEDGKETVQRERTDPYGRVRLPSPAGDLRVVAWTEHATSPRRGSSISEGETVQIELELTPARAFAGIVVDAISGEPVPDAEVRVWTHNETDLIRTGPDGTFEHPRFPTLGKAQQIQVRAEGYGATVRYLKIESSGSWSMLPALKGQATVRGEEDPWIELALVPERRLRGRVLGAHGRPIAGASISVEGFFRVLPAVASRDVASVPTDTEGRFEIQGLRSDISHTLTIAAHDHAEHTLMLEAQTGVEHDVGDVFLDGQSSLLGVVHDAAGQAVEDALVRLIPFLPEGERGDTPSSVIDVPSPFPEGERTVRTDRFGRFAFEGLARGSYRASVERDDDPLAFAHVLESSFATETRTAEIELHLDATALVMHGRVLRGPEPLGSAVVHLRRFGHVATTTTDAEGRFRVSGLDDLGLYEVSVEGPLTNGSREHAQVQVFGHESPVLRLSGEESPDPGS